MTERARHFTGTKGVARPPSIGDVGTIVVQYDPTNFCIECVNDDGMAVWLADFGAAEVKPVGIGPDGRGCFRVSQSELGSAVKRHQPTAVNPAPLAP